MNEMLRIENKKNIAKWRNLIYNLWTITDKVTLLNETRDDLILNLINDCFYDNDKNLHALVSWVINKTNQNIVEKYEEYGYNGESFKKIQTDSDVINYNSFYEPKGDN